MLPNLKTDTSINNETDRLGGSGPVASGLYEHTIKLAYLGKADSGADSIVLHLEDANGKELRSTQWVTTGTAKGNRTYYEKKDGSKEYLHGFNMANSLALLTVGQEIGDLTPEKKTVALYNFTEKKEVPTEVMVFTQLIGKKVISGVIRQTVDKQAKGADGKYAPTGEKRQENEIDKFFRASDRLTTHEIRNKITNAAFYDEWDKAWTGKDRDRSTNSAVAPTGGAGTAKPTASLFAMG